MAGFHFYILFFHCLVFQFLGGCISETATAEGERIFLVPWVVWRLVHEPHLRFGLVGSVGKAWETLGAGVQSLCCCCLVSCLGLRV